MVGVEPINFDLETKDIHCSDTFVLKKPNEVVCLSFININRNKLFLIIVLDFLDTNNE